MASDDTLRPSPATPADEPVDRTFIKERSAVGTVIGSRYRLVERLAAGGMGEVFRAEHVELGRAFALKLMRKELSDDPAFVSRFRLEAVTASKLGHPNIVDIVDSGVSETGQFYFVMELLDGPTLGALIRRKGRLDVAEAVRLTTQIARALAVAHRAGVVHRDLKPENVIVLEREGQPQQVKVVDFGVAKLVQPSPGVKQTTLGVIIGTPQYMSPEQAAGLAVDARSDLYSLGLILFEALTGQPVFAGETAAIVMSKHISAPAPALGPQFPAPLGALVASLLAKAPAERPATMDAVVEALERLAAGQEAPPAKGRRGLVGAAVAAAIVVGGALAWSVSRSSGEPYTPAPRPGPAVVEPAPSPGAPTPAPPAVTREAPAVPVVSPDVVDAGAPKPPRAPSNATAPKPALKHFPTELGGP